MTSIPSSLPALDPRSASSQPVEPVVAPATKRPAVEITASDRNAIGKTAHAMQRWLVQELLKASILESASGREIPSTDSPEADLAGALSLEAAARVGENIRYSSEPSDLQQEFIEEAIKDTEVIEQMQGRVSGFNQTQPQTLLFTLLKQDSIDHPDNLTDLGKALMVFAASKAETSYQSNKGNPLDALMSCETACSLISEEASSEIFPGSIGGGMIETAAWYADRLAEYMLKQGDGEGEPLTRINE